VKSIRFAFFLSASWLALTGCNSGPANGEADREVVLKYVGGNFGTLGPFSKKTKKELQALSSKDQAAAGELLDRGAVGFVIFGPDDGSKAHTKSGTDADLVNVDRIILVQKGQVVGDFRAAQ
jgi:hypothetical protein